MRSLDFFSSANAEYLERLQAQYQRDGKSLPGEWRAFFAGFEVASDGQLAAACPTRAAPQATLTPDVSDLVHSYRELGHCVARLDPLAHLRPDHPLLELSEFGFSAADLGRQVGAGTFLGPTDGTLRSLVENLK